MSCNSANYKLLPFNFSRVAGREVMVNELGDLIIAPEGTVAAIANHQEIDAELYKTLVANFFLCEGVIHLL